MKWWYCFLFAFVLACGQPAEEQPADTPEAKPDTTVGANAPGVTAAKDVPEGNVPVLRQEYTDCLEGYEVETAPYLRYTSFENGTLSMEIGFWSNCCGERAIVANSTNGELQLDIYQVDDACRCRCCYSAVLEVGNLESDPTTIRFGEVILKQPKEAK